MSFEPSISVCILGAGFSGTGAGIKLQTKLNIKNYTIFDENHDFGGTWLTHTYPGCACDVNSHLYSYSFELNPNWTCSYARQPEILEYLQNIAKKYDLYSRAKFNHKVISACWDELINKWRVVVLDKIQDKTEERIYDIVISGVGGLRVANIPDQFRNFKGSMIHSSKWDANIDLENKTVAVIGSGASAVQIVPEIIPNVKKLLSFQRHPAWVAPISLYNFPQIVKSVFKLFPFLMWFFRVVLFFFNELTFPAFWANNFMTDIAASIGKKHLKEQIPNNPDLQNKLTPDYRFGCKRVTPSNRYYLALADPKSEVVTNKIIDVKDGSIITEDGTEYKIDVVILATGYRVQDFFAPLVVKGKKSIDLLAAIKMDPKHYLGITFSSAPNAFMLLGPNTGYGHNSVVFSIECQLDWIIQVIREMIRRDSRVVCVKSSVEKEYFNEIKRRMKGLVWGAFSCGSWYADENGIITTIYPGSLISYWRETRKPDFNKLEFD